MSFNRKISAFAFSEFIMAFQTLIFLLDWHLQNWIMSPWNNMRDNNILFPAVAKCSPICNPQNKSQASKIGLLPALQMCKCNIPFFLFFPPMSLLSLSLSLFSFFFFFSFVEECRWDLHAVTWVLREARTFCWGNCLQVNNDKDWN